MEWFKKHADTIVILAAFASYMLWMNGKFNSLEKDIIMIKTALIKAPAEIESLKKIMLENGKE